ncbi:pheromone receptor [Aspergillus undulatus]|uniref:pheromone receptor n=1 Tax=Aspergillus undulatus TaxID=1810928 RepID=UPI003CCD518C
MESTALSMSPSAQGVVLQTLSILSILASVPPLALHWKNRNFPAVTLICWFVLLNVFSVLNAFVWPTDDIENWWDGEGLCDIEVKMMIASYVAVPGSLVCIFRSLAFVLDTSRATLVPSKRQRWRNRIMELSFCAVIPFVAAAMHLIWQGNRYFIYAVSGCLSSLDQSWVSLALGYIWPLVVCFIGSYYCALVLIRLRRYGNQFNEIIRANSGFNKSRFLRLFSLSFIMLLALIPMQTYVLYAQIEVSFPWHPYSWSGLQHTRWSQIQKVPTNGVVFFDRWIPVAAGFMCFIFFGCGRDATRVYRAALRPLGLDCCFSPMQTTTSDSFPRNMSGSFTSRAHLIPGGENHAAQNPPSISVGSASTTITYGSNFNPKDIEEGLSSSQSPQIPRTRWSKLKTHLSWFGRPFKFPPREAMRMRTRSTSHLAIPSGSNTISTNAWAGTSQSCGSIDLDTLPPRADFIRVKQVIRQEREMQV